MSARKILLVTYHFPPSAASGTFRLLGFTRHLPRFGWEPVVVAPPELPWEPVDQRLTEQVPEQIKVYPAPYPHHWPKVVRWAAPYAVWLPAGRRACRQAIEAEKPDLVLTSGPPHWVHLIGLYLKKKYGLPWLADFRDPWINGLDRQLARTPKTWWQQRCEKKIMRHADRVLANAPFACRKIQDAYPAEAEKIVTLTNGFDPLETPASDKAVRSGMLRVVHTGQIYSGRDPRPFLDAVAQLIKAPDIPPFVVDFVGRTTGHGVDVAEQVKQRGLGSVVRVRDQVPYSQSLKIMQEADVLLLLDSPGRRVGVPAKLYEYFASGRAVLGLAETDGDTACILRESGIVHELARPTDADAIVAGLWRLLITVAQGAKSGKDGEKLKSFTREHLAGQLADMLNGVLGVAPASPRPLSLVGAS